MQRLARAVRPCFPGAGQRGLSLVEVLAATSIAAVVLAPLALLNIASQLWAGQGALMSQATIIAYATLDALRFSRFNEIASSPEAPSAINPFFRVTIEVSEVRYNLKDVTVTVTWPGMKVPPIKLRTYIAATDW